ncbi:unnamed protein product (macronuclear) [Paramecium tetraurelia]|uniref:SPRY domain-containing protein n=1 Tax=Paramecium tetraurelia TaxID=5888 RepID=A0EIP1_PARTE|nr:uncharacterized protein GSPATT00027511001 [Paramecium tetraurelia]CAK95182.1 unnamed protein product [Paramecium tetraurelia]|eukprot:XP_001462555.1 hypothetical protein (macronuclear) [Paramecium tetraurelia strain d4-2]
MDLSNLFGYEESQQQPLIQPFIQPQKVNDEKESIIQIKRNITKKNKKLNLFDYRMAVKPSKKASTKEQGPMNNIGTNQAKHLNETTLLKILEYSEVLRSMLCNVDNLVKKQLQESNEDKLVISRQEINIDSLQNCLTNCLLQFIRIQSNDPNNLFENQNNCFSLSMISAQKELRDNHILQKHLLQHSSIKFSGTQKHESIKLAKMRLQATSNLYGCAICEESLSKEVVSKFAFKINKIDGNISIGICNKDIMAKQNYQHTDSNQTEGLYLLDNCGRMYPNSGNQVMYGQPFEFEESNIIIVIVDFQMQCIKWKKYNHQSIIVQLLPQFQCIPFNINYELSPCVVFSKPPQFRKTSQVTIVNPKTLRVIDGSCNF